MNCATAKDLLLGRLRRAIEAHEQGRFTAIEDGAQELPDLDACLEEDEAGYLRLSSISEFLDRWADARNHDWAYYPGIKREDWPVLARRLYQNVEQGRDPDELCQEARVFNLPEREPFWTPLFRWILRLAGRERTCAAERDQSD